MSTTSSSNYTTLYSGNANPVVPTTGYGNANVVSLLAVGSDGANTVTNIVATGNITGNYFIGNGSQLTGISGSGNYSNANVSAFLPVYGGNIDAITVSNNDGVAMQSGAYVQMQYTGASPAPVDQYNVGTGSWLYLDSTGGIFESNTTGSVNRITLGNDGSVSAVGNITGDYILGNGSQLTGINANYSNANVAAFLPVYGGNIDAQNISNTVVVNLESSGFSQLQYSPVLTGDPYDIGTGSWLYVDSAGAAFESNVTGTFNSVFFGNDGQVSATGNITGNYILGNGSQLTGLPATYGNSNVATYLASGTNTQDIITSGTVQGNLLTTAGASGNIIGVDYVSANYYLGNGSLLTGVVATSIGTLPSLSVTGNIDTGNLRTAGLVTATGNVTGGNINTAGGVYVGSVVSAVGNVRGGNINTGGVVTATGNVYGNYFVGNGSALTGVVATSIGTLPSLSVTGNTQSGNLLTAGVVSATGNITGSYFIGNGSQLTGIAASYGNANVVANLAALGSNPVSTTGNITAGYFVGNGSLLTTITGGNVTGTVANATYATTAGSATTATTAGTVTANAQANITSVGVLTSLSVSGNTQSGNLLTAGVVSATGNITGNYFIGNGSALTGISASPGGANTQIQFNNASAFAGNAAMTFDVTTGNIGMGNLILSSGNITNRINTIAPFNGQPGNATAFGNGQILIGNGWNGNIALTSQIGASSRGAKFIVADTANIADSGGPRYAGIAATPYLILSGNVSNVNTNMRAGAFVAQVGGSSSNYQLQLASMGAVAGSVSFLSVGQPNTAVALGNTTVYAGVGSQSQITVQSGSSMGNAGVILSAAGGGGNVTNLAGMILQLNGFPLSTPTNVYGVYMNSSTTNGIFGNSVNSNQIRNATNYYFLRNDDNVAQTKLGSLRLFNEFQYDGANTSGTLAVDKNNGQVQTVYITGDITSVTFSNFVTSASTGSTTKYQTDTVTLILRQDSTGYAVTMPTGTAYKYAAGASTVGTTANSVTMISITGTYDSVSAADQYLITISPEFT